MKPSGPGCLPVRPLHCPVTGLERHARWLEMPTCRANVDSRTEGPEPDPCCPSLLPLGRSPVTSLTSLGGTGHPGMLPLRRLDLQAPHPPRSSGLCAVPLPR